MVHAMVALAPGSEEIEAVSIIDTLRRGQFEVDVVSLADELTLECSRGVNIVADKLLDECAPQDYQLIVLPGGAAGSEYMTNHPPFIEFLEAFYHTPNYLAAICAAPAVVLTRRKIAPNATMTCHPDFFNDLNYKTRSEQRVVVDRENRLITSRGPGTAIEFSLAILAELGGEALAQQVAAPMLCQGVD